MKFKVTKFKHFQVWFVYIFWNTQIMVPIKIYFLQRPGTSLCPENKNHQILQCSISSHYTMATLCRREVLDRLGVHCFINQTSPILSPRFNSQISLLLSLKGFLPLFGSKVHLFYKM